MPEEISAKLDRVLLRRLWKLFGIMFQRFNSRSSVIFYILSALVIILQFVIYAAGLVPSRFFEVLGAKDKTSFTQLTFYSISIIVLNAVMTSTSTYLSKVLYLTWRQTLCTRIHESYFSNLCYYKLNVLEKQLDNIDQRITRDADQFTREWSILISRLIVIPLTICYYSYQCFVSTTWLGPVTIYIYFILGTIINRLIMPPIVKLNIEKEVKEGNFRFQHLQVRVNAESFAFYRAGKIELVTSNNRLRTLLKTQMSLFNWSYWLDSSINIFNYVGGILSYLIIAIPIFAGDYDHVKPEELSAIISKNAFVCIYLIYSFSQLISMSGAVGDIAAHTHRLGQLIERIEEDTLQQVVSENFENDTCSDKQQMLEKQSHKFIEEVTPTETETNIDKITAYNGMDTKKNLFVLDDVTYSTPDDKTTLLTSLNLSLQSGKNILVTGETGCGKTSLLRVLAKLWDVGSGTIQQFVGFGSRGVFYLPQKPLMTYGTLQSLMMYPRTKLYPEYSEAEDLERLEQIMKDVGLGDFIKNNGGLTSSEEKNWSDKLSPGEMQQISFSRLFYHHPDLAVLDEPSSGLNEEVTNRMFQMCASRNITCLTVSHGNNLKKYHDVELHLLGNGKWNLTSLL